MAATGVSTESIDYLQRSQRLPAEIAGPYTAGAVPTRRLLQVSGIGRPDKQTRARLRPPEEAWRSPMTGLITGLYGYRIPLAYLLEGTGQGVRIQLGTWAALESASPDGQDRRSGVLAAVLRGLYSSVAIEAGAPALAGLPLGGLALGVPAPDGIDDADGSAPVDRVIRSLGGGRWLAFVLAYPVGEPALSTLRAQVLNEIRAVQSAAAGEGSASPLAEQYVDELTFLLTSLSEGLATGAWRTATYLLGDGETYPKLAAAWRSVFSGPQSRPEPVRVFDRPDVAGLAGAWAMSDETSAAGPGHFRRPFEFQTVLTTAQLAACVHLPELETPGFSIDLAPRFDTVAPSAAAAARAGHVVVGEILDHKRGTGAPYQVSLSSLTRHALVAGTTGAGKTNTIFTLLREADAAGVPFLVIEPAKTEYRAMLDDPQLGGRLRVFTPGRDTVSPLRLNPFAAPEVTVSEHLDLVRSAFAASFGMWTPLPQILERCLHEVYLDRGWDLRTNENHRLRGGGDASMAYPTMSDVVVKATEVIAALGYDDKVTGDLRAALTTRLESLTIGGKGAMLDVAESLPIAELLSGPTVVELEALGDAADKAFLTALLLTRLAEYRRSQGQQDRLVHLLVVEEAHRLLSNVPATVSDELANPRGQAVETFANLLSEIRAYGQGVIIADQIPARLAPDAIKNTTLKIAHRTVPADDRAVLGAAMAMEDEQTRALTSLEVGEAAVFGTGDDGPLMVRIPLAKNPLSPRPPGDGVVADRMRAWRAASGAEDLYWPRPFCAQTCTGAPAECAAARQLAGDEYLQRAVAALALSLTGEAGALDRLWPDLLSVIDARRPPRLRSPELLRAVAGHASDWYAGRRGAQGAWSFADTAGLGDLLRAAWLDQLAGGSTRSAELRAAYQHEARRLHQRAYAPYPVCADVCAQDPPLCLYRSAVADLVASRRFRPSWLAADTADAQAPGQQREQTWEVCQDAAFDLVEFPDPANTDEVNEELRRAGKRVCLCFAQQMLADDDRKVPRTSRRILARVLTEAGL